MRKRTEQHGVQEMSQSKTMQGLVGHIQNPDHDSKSNEKVLKGLKQVALKVFCVL